MEKQTDQLLDHLRSKVQNLQKLQLQSQKDCADLKNQLQKTQAANATILTQIDVQKNKYLALTVFVAELQRKYDTQFTDLRMMGSVSDTLGIEKAFLKQQLIKKGEEAEQYRKVNQCIKSMSEGRGKSLAETQFIEQQSETLAKLGRKLAEFRNEELLCTRKWTNLQKQNTQLENRFRSLKLQQQRQSVTTQELYEEYLDKVNKNNTRLAYLQGAMDEKIISEHLIEEVSLVQQERLNTEMERNELRDQFALMQRDYENIKKENLTLKEFFSDRSEESRLTNRMRLRVEQLNDLLTDYKKGVSEPRLLALSKTVDNVRVHLQKLKEANKYLEQRLQESMKGNACIDDVVAGKFFSNLLAEKDEQIKYQRKICQEMKSKLAELRFRKEAIKGDIEKMRYQMEPQSLQHRVNTRALERQILNEFTFNEADR